MGQLIFQATLGGQVSLVGPNTASSYTLNIPTVNGNLVTTGDTGTVTNTMLVNSSLTIGSTAISLGGTSTTLAGLTGVTSSAITNSGLTSGRVTYAGASGLLSDSATLTYNGTTLTATTGANFCTTSGSVGIGTSSPEDKLSVYGDSVNKIAAYLENNNAAGASGSDKRLSLIMGGSSAFSITGWQNAGVIEATSTGGLWLGAYNGAIKFATGSSARTERMRIDSSGNVLINTTSNTNSAKLKSKVSAGAVGFEVTDEASSDFVIIPAVSASVCKIGPTAGALAIQTAGTERMRIDSSGIVTMSAYGAGAATFSAAGVISSVSDETWKTKDGVPTNPDVMLQKLEPGYWFYNEEKAPIYGQDRQLGFYAQNVHEAIGAEAAPTPEEGKPWGYYDRSVLAIAVMSLKNALNTIEELKQRIETLENK